MTLDGDCIHYPTSPQSNASASTRPFDVFQKFDIYRNTVCMPYQTTAVHSDQLPDAIDVTVSRRKI